MVEIEKPVAFYLGKRFDIAANQLLDEPVFYDARDLTTHGVCLGMTGSGKTGLCIDLLEEATLDGVPSILIDPKGDITNMLLTFPELRPEDFEPWVNPDDARRKGLTISQYATEVANLWREGLAKWGQTPERIRKLRESAEFVIYTPGSDAGMPVSILHSLDAPGLSWENEEETLREQIRGTVSATLGLAGITSDPITGREHILLATLFEHAWRRGENLDIAKLILWVQNPPVRRIGVFDMDTFFPPKERFGLAVALNNIIAAPSFQNWIKGHPLDIESILWTEQRQPRVAIFYIAHLSDAERMFFVTLLLQQIQTWMRKQSGTTSLRCIVYFDELYGYFPPYPANPPSKQPILSLLKTARAYGVGLLLTTQNPVDLDYKGLTNIGTWFIGKLQTDRDKMRVLEGLEGIGAETGTLLDRNYLDRAITSLQSRVFILHNINQAQPIAFMTRWAMSYLRGPLTKSQVQTLMAPTRKEIREQVTQVLPTEQIQPSAQISSDFLPVPPTLAAEISQYFLLPNVPWERVAQKEEERRGRFNVQSRQLVYKPHAIGWATVHIEHAPAGIAQTIERSALIEPPEDMALVDWDNAQPVLSRDDLSSKPPAEALYWDVPPTLSDPRKLRALRDSFSIYLLRGTSLNLFQNRSLGLLSEPGETLEAFKTRCEAKAQQLRGEQIDALHARYDKQIERVQERLRRKERELQRNQAELAQRKRDETISAGESILGVFLGRRAIRSLSVASTKRRLTQQAEAKVSESQAAIQDLKAQIEDLEKSLQEEEGAIASKLAELVEAIEEVRIGPKKRGVTVDLFGIAWVPFWHVICTTEAGTTETLAVAAYRVGT